MSRHEYNSEPLKRSVFIGTVNDHGVQRGMFNPHFGPAWVL